MKILYDHQIFSYQEYGGASRYFYEVISRLPSDMWDITVKISNNYLLNELNINNKLHYSNFLPNMNFYKKGRIMLELGKKYSLNEIKKNDYDVLHLTHYESYCINSTKKPIVLSYLDKLFSSYEYNPRTIAQQKKCLEKAAAVICISENTKKDFLSLFDYPEEKTHVIYLGTNGQIHKPIIKKSCRYVLFVGGRLGYKNFRNFCIAYSKISQNDPDLYLKCTGKSFTNEEIAFLKSLKIYNKTTVQYVSDTELATLYANAECFVFPSKYEGFGMPLLEAMNYECPVCCSNSHCFPEIAGDAACYFNPDDIDDIKNKIESVVYSQKEKTKLIENGNMRKKCFSWDRTAQEHIKLYESLVR